MTDKWKLDVVNFDLSEEVNIEKETLSSGKGAGLGVA